MRYSWWSALTGVVMWGLVGWGVGALVALALPDLWGLLALAGGLGGAVAGAVLSPWLVDRSLLSLHRAVGAVPTGNLLLTAVGLLTGLVAGALLAFPLSRLPGLAGQVAPAVVSLLLAFGGAYLLLLCRRDLAEVFPQVGRLLQEGARRGGLILVDTSAIIDGRIADLVKTGFVSGTLGVPRFVLDELRRIADSSDPLRRNRGRRGLEVLNRLRKEATVPLQVLDADARNGADVDSRLVRLARRLRAPILSNDYNLNRVAQLQGVKVLNINELVNALKPVVLPGEEMVVRIIQEGKEAGQGVGFMDDGTMVVVEGGKPYINSYLSVVVTRVLQTGSGRIIFAQPKEERA